VTPDTERLFHLLADLSVSARNDYFLEHSVAAEVRAEVEALLAHDAPDDGGLTASVAAVVEQSLQQMPGDPAALIGPCRLLRVLGQGGMGTVHLAERADGEVRQQVALKLIRFGRSETAFRERFLRERQILASLNHAGIARLLDAGHTADGQPYLAMDYVDGEPIDRYCAALSVTARLRLFLRVCDAVAFAHRNLIVHRDLKPSNILVDSAGQPKLLDFGIARILDEDSQEQTLTMERMMTPEYASPEQIRGAAQTTTTDVYSLGAVLYKLLAGRPPHATGEGTREQLLDSILTREPERASRVNRDVPQDLDFILSKALRKEPDQRYLSVESFSEDLVAFLESRPVAARKGDAWYRTRKFVTRYRLPVAAAAIAVASLSTGLYVANSQRVIAQLRFLQVRQLANQFIQLDVDVRELTGSTDVRKKIVAESLAYLTALGREAPRDPQLAWETGNAYLQVARVQGVPVTPNLGQFAEAEISLNQAETLMNTVLQGDGKNRAALMTAAEIAHDWMTVADYQNHHERAMQLAEVAGRRLNERLALGSLSPEEVDTATHLFSNLGVAYSNSQKLDEAIRMSRRALEISEGVPAAQMRRASAFGVLAVSLRGKGDLDGAYQASVESLRDLEKIPVGAARDSNLVRALERQGMILGEDSGLSLGRSAEAKAVFRRALDVAEDQAKRDPIDTRSRFDIAITTNYIGDIDRHTDPAGALVLYEHGLRRVRETKPNARMRIAEADLLSASAYAYRALHRNVEAARSIEASFAILKEIGEGGEDKVQPGDEVSAAMRAQADHLAETGQVEKAVAAYEDLLKKMMAWGPHPEADLAQAEVLSRTWLEMARLYRRVNRAEDGLRMEKQNRELWDELNRKLPNRPYVLGKLSAAAASGR